MNQYHLKKALLTFLFCKIHLGSATCIINDQIMQDLPAEKFTQKLFTEHRLPLNFKELYDAKEASTAARMMLDEGKGVKALPYILFAEKNYEPESLSVIWDIAQGRYREIPKTIQSALQEKLSDPNAIMALEENYKKMFVKNHQDLIKKSQQSPLSCAFDYISKNYFSFKPLDKKSKIANNHISFEQSLKTQKLSTPEQKIDIITSQEEMHLLKKIS